MIVFDTNLVSEAIKPNCDERVAKWLSRLDSELMATTTINLAELWSGIAIMPDGKRKSDLKSMTEAYVAVAFRENVFAFDTQSAVTFAEIFGDMKTRGKSILLADCQIAAIAVANGCTIATRDVHPFRAAGLHVINPWTDE